MAFVKHPQQALGKRRLADSGSRWRVGSFEFAGAARVLRQADEQQYQLTIRTDNEG
jgi:hypothetical protein